MGGREGKSSWLPLALFAVALVLAVFINVGTKPPTVWGLLPIVFYAVVVLLGVDVVLATLGALVVAVVMRATPPKELAGLMATSLGAFITVVGLIIILGSGLGQVAKETGVAEYFVHTIIHRIGVRTRKQVQFGIMLTSTLLVGMLGTLAGANAILAPIIIPIAAAVGFTPPAVAAMLHAGGAPGLFLGPFTPPVVTLTGTAKVGYLPYLAWAGLPMGIATWITGFFMVRWIQRRTEGSQAYEEADIVQKTPNITPQVKRGTWAFVISLLALVIYGITIKAGYSYAILVMLVVSFITGLAAGRTLLQVLQYLYAGASKLIWLFLLFWLFNPLMELVGQAKAYEALLEIGKPVISAVGAFGFSLLALLIGWIGVAGAAVAQVVLMDKVFGPTVQTLGISALAWVMVLLGSSQLDWFGPFPNADMVGQMGLARSKDLRLMMYNGWMIMAVNLVVIAVVIAILTFI